VILLDTNVLSELMRATPEPRVIAWLNEQVATRVHAGAPNEAEILTGIGLLPKGKRRDALAKAARALFDEDLAGRVLPFSSAAARCYAEIVVVRQAAGRPISTIDAMVAAIAKANGAVLATRNVDDFRDCGVEWVSPWDTAKR
jgi:predicted nucleic acid-binding protein